MGIKVRKKSQSVTLANCGNLIPMSIREDNGISSVRVKSANIGRNIKGEGNYLAYH